ncbi:MAG: hypothetical protein V2I48_00745 [Xanthomonadales bacterium]|jgi:hypothetical protein|nr:hypothetical protein [Xanthomonadales bacterium]
MAEFSAFDASQASIKPSWWETRSKKAPIGRGINSAYAAMIKALTSLAKDQCMETAQHSRTKASQLEDLAANLPLIKSGVKPNQYFFTALSNLQGLCQKIEVSERGARQTNKQKEDTIAGKGSADTANKPGNWE